METISTPYAPRSMITTARLIRSSSDTPDGLSNCSRSFRFSASALSRWRAAFSASSRLADSEPLHEFFCIWQQVIRFGRHDFLHQPGSQDKYANPITRGCLHGIGWPGEKRNEWMWSADSQSGVFDPAATSAAEKGQSIATASRNRQTSRWCLRQAAGRWSSDKCQDQMDRLRVVARDWFEAILSKYLQHRPVLRQNFRDQFV
jgi:hypothetical protein